MPSRFQALAIRSLCATTALALPAMAQAQYTPPDVPPIRETIDGNGVDLTRGTVVSRSHSVSIGGPSKLGLYSDLSASIGATRVARLAGR